jgi:hypothetical protein
MKAQLTRAEGFFELGMHQEAWNTLEELPPIDRVEPLVLELRLRILTALEEFGLGESIASVLVSRAIEPARCRETVGSLCGRQVMRGPRSPKIRVRIVNDP